MSEAVSSRRILLQAFGVHTGGGRVLLDEVLTAAGGRVGVAALDTRYIDNSPIVERLKAQGTEIVPVPPAVAPRLRALRLLALQGGADDVLLHFNSLPPLVRSAARTITFLHASYLVDDGIGAHFPLPVRARFLFERTLLRLGAGNVDEFWVQSKSIELALKRHFPYQPVRIVPFVDQEIMRLLADKKGAAKDGTDFFYPADGGQHKNHLNLFKAWEILNSQAKDAKLFVTLDPATYEDLLKKSEIPISVCNSIVNLGALSRDQVLDRLRNSALIFPSISETFGIPLLEATAIGVPILASELDYTRDVCVPTETFDPQSPRSIARAVRRFLGSPELPRSPISGAEFVELLGK